ncbi:VDE lipocalin domain-containing protein [Fragilaria crotonensis]|nr:VDE lipocalin domain-containing protein [Fragilaria crotonensis]
MVLHSKKSLLLMHRIVVALVLLVAQSHGLVPLVPTVVSRLSALPLQSKSQSASESESATSIATSTATATSTTARSPRTFFAINNVIENAIESTQSTLLALALSCAFAVATPMTVAPAHAADSLKIATCLFQKCQLPLAKCVANPKCLANVICINTCNGRPDETECQIQCGNLWENDVVGEFNKCAVSQMSCVPQKPDDGSYPIPFKEVLPARFDTSFFQGRWYITAGQNELFDRFPCQVHFFTETKPGTFFGKLNWRIEEPDGEFFTRDALQRFVQDPNQPAHLLNHDNEYLHYQDDWYIIDYEPDPATTGSSSLSTTPDSAQTPPFAFVYYRGSNDAWDGYGGVVVYTRASQLPESLLPRLRAAAKKVNMDFDRDFAITDNSCPTISPSERAVLRERFAGKVVLETEQQVQAAATRVRGNALNGVKAQQLFVQKEIGQAEAAFEELSQKTVEFEEEVVQNAVEVVKEVAAVGK